MKRTSLENHHQEGHHESARVAGDPVEIVQIDVPILAEVVAIVSFIGMILVWIAIANTPAVSG